MMSGLNMTPMRRFLLILAGQTVSSTGGALTAFGLGIWLLRHEASILGYSMVIALSALPGILLAPLAGGVVDKIDPRKVMLAAEISCACLILALLAILSGGQLHTWHVYAVASLGSVFQTFQTLAYQVGITRLMPKDGLARANGMVQLSNALSQLAGPMLAGAMLGWIGLQGLVTVDLLSVCAAITALMFVRIPAASPEALSAGHALSHAAPTEGDDGSVKFAQAFAFLRSRPKLLGMLMYFAVEHFLVGFVATLVAPIVLVEHSELALGTVMTCGGLGLLAGSLLVMTWPPRRLLPTILGCHVLLGTAIASVGLSSSLPVLYGCAFTAFLCLPLIDSADQTFWQRKIPLRLLGRVFAMRHVVILGSLPCAALVGGALSDFFIPLLKPSGALAVSVGQWFGVGPARGVSFLFFIAGILCVALAAIGMRQREFRRLDIEMSDWDSSMKPLLKPASYVDKNWSKSLSRVPFKHQTF